jgi:hypothetical protein
LIKRSWYLASLAIILVIGLVIYFERKPTIELLAPLSNSSTGVGDSHERFKEAFTVEPACRGVVIVKPTEHGDWWFELGPDNWYLVTSKDNVSKDNPLRVLNSAASGQSHDMSTVARQVCKIVKGEAGGTVRQ